MREKNRYYVNETMYIPQQKRTGDFLFFIRDIIRNEHNLQGFCKAYLAQNRLYLIELEREQK